MFTCTSKRRSNPQHGQFVVVQVVDVNQDDPRIDCFRSGGCRESQVKSVPVQEEKSSGEKTDEDPPKPGDSDGDQTGNDETNSDYLHDVDLKDVGLPDHPVKALDLLKNNGLNTAQDVLDVGEVAIGAIDGIGVVTSKKIMELCHQAIEQAKAEDKAGSDEN